jgi:hypothetical protein
MNDENYGRFLEVSGHRVISSPSGFWFDISRMFYESLPPFRVITPDQTEIDALFRQCRMIGLKYCAPDDHTGKGSWFFVCQEEDYDLKSLHPKMRNKVRQGLRNCTVRPITFEYLHDHGMPLNQDTLKRHGRDDPTFSQPADWARLCQAGRQVEGTGAWGAFVGDQLAAYMITFMTHDYINILHQMSRTDLLKSRANNALAFIATREMLSLSSIQGISYGQASIRGESGLDEYKFRLGYVKWPMRYVVILHPLLKRILLSQAGHALLGRMNRLFPDHDVLKRVNGIVDIVRQSQVAGLSRERRIELERRSGNGEETL